jgi:hypothetical protein
VDPRRTTTLGQARLRFEDGRQQTREVASGTSFLSQHSLVQHFGLGKLERADALEIRWPSGQVQRLEGIAANQSLEVVEPA